MSEEEVRRSGILKRVQDGELSQVEAAELLGISYRQTKRLMARYRRGGATGLVHGNVGRRSNRAKPGRLRQRVLQLVKKHYQGPGEPFGPTLAAEHLEQDHGIRIDAETLRRWMLAEGLWQKARKRSPYRQRRPRRAHFGELLQMDGSFHAWLEDRGPGGCLIDLVDDATSTVLAQLHEEETTWAVALTLRAWVEQYGIPRALYVDWKNVYHHQPTAREKRSQQEVISQFQGMCRKLGTDLIGANSPQAKGRVERSHSTHQDRFIKKMRLRKIATHEQANQFLRDPYLPEHNRRFAVPAKGCNLHEPVPPHMDLDEVFCLEQQRTLSRDWVVRYENRFLQLAPSSRVQPGTKITVRERWDGSLRLWAGGDPLAFEELAERPRQPPALVKPKLPQKPNLPAANHPWRQPLPAPRGPFRAERGKGTQTPSPCPAPPSPLPAG